jgi:hypothetical protein
MKTKRRKWREHELQYLSLNIDKPINDLSKYLDRPAKAIQLKINTLSPVWMPKNEVNIQDQAFIKKWYPVFGLKYCLRYISCNERACKYFIRLNCLKIQDNISYDIYDYFPDIFAPEVLYILGLAWADGSVTLKENKTYRLCISLKESDAESIKHIFLKWPKYFKWRYHYITVKAHVDKGNIKVKETKRIDFNLNDKYFIKFLVDSDYKIKSGASPDKILSKIPESLRHYWWRGYFDGDGHYYVSQKRGNNSKDIGFTSTYDQDWSFCENLCQKLGINGSINKFRKINAGRSQFRISKGEDMKKIINYLYSLNLDISMKRKREKIINLPVKDIIKTSKYIGVSKRGNKWIAYFNKKYCGTFDTEEEAYKIRLLEENKNENISGV